MGSNNSGVTAFIAPLERRHQSSTWMLMKVTEDTDAPPPADSAARVHGEPGVHGEAPRAHGVKRTAAGR